MGKVLTETELCGWYHEDTLFTVYTYDLEARVQTNILTSRYDNFLINHDLIIMGELNSKMSIYSNKRWIKKIKCKNVKCSINNKYIFANNMGSIDVYTKIDLDDLFGDIKHAAFV